MKKVNKPCALCKKESESSICIDCEEEAFEIIQQIYEEEYQNELRDNK